MPTCRSPFPVHLDKRIRLIGPIVLFFIGAIFLRLKMLLEMPHELLLRHFAIALSAGYTCWELTRFTTLFIQHHLPGLERLRQRLYFLAIALVVLSHFGFTIRHIAHYFLNHDVPLWPNLFDYTGTMGVTIFYTTVTICIYETGYVWQQGKKTMAEKERLLQSEWQAKYDLLKSQINPHFLFNSLNSLSLLVGENPSQAEKFIDEMSKIYRYLLRSNDRELVTLDTELQFIRSYCHLLTTRYGSGFQLRVEVNRLYDNYLIPPLTLQLLIENVVKHNIVQKEHPVLVTIQVSDDERLIVANNVQKKNAVVFSNGMGLANISARFKLLNRQNIIVEEVDGRFVVSIPLIQHYTADVADDPAL